MQVVDDQGQGSLGGDGFEKIAKGRDQSEGLSSPRVAGLGDLVSEGRQGRQTVSRGPFRAR